MNRRGGPARIGPRGSIVSYERTKPLWRVLTPPEWKQIWQHVATCDFPETAAVWCELGREAGFREARQVFVDPTDFFQLFRFEA